MSKSLKRVQQALLDLGLGDTVITTAEAKTAEMAAKAVGCAVDQIAKSIILAGEGDLYLFVTAGAQQVDMAKATTLVGQPLTRASADAVRRITGFAIGGVSPVGHLNPIDTFQDITLSQFDTIYAAAGTPHHVFKTTPTALAQATRAKVSDFV